MPPSDLVPDPEQSGVDAAPADARTPPARPDEREAGDGGRSRGTSAEAPEEIAGRPGTTQHVPPDGVPPGAERRDPPQEPAPTEGGRPR
jgi:hypothetical protein